MFHLILVHSYINGFSIQIQLWTVVIICSLTKQCIPELWQHVQKGPDSPGS